MTRYRTIVADPPWAQPSGGPRSSPVSACGRAYADGTPSVLPYATMTVDEIAALPVRSLAYPDAHLYLWTTNAFLERAFTLVLGWGFRPSQVLTWVKTPRGLGMGGAFTSTTEFVLFARRGSLSPLSREDSTWWQWPRGPHSKKPDAFMDMVERVSPGPRLEMFARRQRLGWDTWGDEALEHVEISA